MCKKRDIIKIKHSCVITLAQYIKGKYDFTLMRPNENCLVLILLMDLFVKCVALTNTWFLIDCLLLSSCMVLCTFSLTLIDSC